MKFQNNKSPSNANDNYNYYESKKVIKQGRLNLPITIHHRRGEEDDSSQKYQRTFNYNKITKKLNSNLSHKYIQNSNLKINNKSNTRLDNSRNIQQSTFRKEASSITNRIGGRLNQNYSQKNKLNYNNLKYQLNRSIDVRNNLLKNQYNGDNDLVDINCPVHGRRKVRRSKLRELGIIVNK